jgi:hypothetical protein
MIAGSRRRLLAHLLAGDAEAAAREMEWNSIFASCTTWGA